MNYFIKVDQPTALHKDLLECAKQGILYHYADQELTAIRNRKREVLHEIDGLLGEIHGHLDDLDHVIDVSDFIEEEKETEDVTAKATKSRSEPSKPSKTESGKNLDEVDRMEYTLRRIEETLSNLE